MEGRLAGVWAVSDGTLSTDGRARWSGRVGLDGELLAFDLIGIAVHSSAEMQISIMLLPELELRGTIFAYSHACTCTSALSITTVAKHARLDAAGAITTATLAETPLTVNPLRNGRAK